MTALLLAVSLFLNTVVLPVHAEGTATPTEQTVTESELSDQEELLTLEETVPETTAETVPETTVETVPETTEETMPETTVETVPETTEETVPETTVETVPETTEETVPETTVETAPETTTETEEGEVIALSTGDPLTLSDVFGNYADSSTELAINSSTDLILLSHVAPEKYQNLNLTFANNESDGYNTTNPAQYNGTNYSFQGLGNSDYPYKGTVTIIQGTQQTPIELSQPLFNALSDSASIGDNTNGVLLKYCTPEGGKKPSALLAEQVVHDSSADIVRGWYIRTVSASGATSAPPIIGTIQDDAKVFLNVNNNESSDSYVPITNVVGSTHAGFLCAEMAENSSLTLNSWTGTMPTVEAKSGDAGSLVGNMASGAALNLGESGAPAISNVTASGSAGGLVGSAVDAPISLIPLSGSDVTIKGNHAGGLIGSYTYSGVADALSTISQSISGITVNGSSNAGGVFGVLNNISENAAFTINSDSVSTTLTTNSTSGNAGGLIGQYSAIQLGAGLNLQPGTVTSILTNSANTYGGLIGWVSGDLAAYIEICGKTAEGAETPAPITVQAKGTANYYGGLIGALSNSGHMVKTGSVTVTKNDIIKGNNAAGGLVGNMPSGVLCLDGNVSVATPEGNQNNRGGILGSRGNTLVYTTDKGKTDWPYYNSSSCNAIGNWGQVIRADTLSNLLTIDANKHTVTVVGLTNDTISTATDFAAAALRFQLDSKGALVIPEGTDFAHTVSLTLSGTIDLSDTGLTGFQRDYSEATAAPVTLTGSGDATIIFPDITVYTGNSHNRQGLFAKSQGLTVSNLTLKDGRTTENPETCGIRVSTYANDTYAGALVAESSGTVSLTNVKSYVNITKTGNNANERISGLIAYQNGSSVTFSDCAWDSYLIYNGSNACYMGGFLARTNNAVTITVKGNCTISGSIEKTGGETNYSGGLIGSLIDNQNSNWVSKLIITGLTADGVTIISPTARKTGGILGWEWMTATTEISGVTVKNCTLVAPNARFGGLVYKGSGYWKVDGTGIIFEAGENAEGQTVANTFTGASSQDATSGLLLAVGDKQEDIHKNALYLEIQEGAYTIVENSVTLTNTYEYFDEIIGQTEHEKGNGIVSIATSEDLIYKETTEENGTISKERRTYVNRLGAFKNPNTRYYYNLDAFGAGENPTATGDVDTAPKMVLFSAYSHCYSGLQKYFYAGKPGSITGNIDLTGYSYYPAEQFVDISGATVNFAYEEMNGFETDNKPFSDSERQHYGMHTGIFTGVSGQGGARNVSDLTLQGTVGGLDGNYGALIRDGASGKDTTNMLTLNINGVTLDGIKASGIDEVKPLLINSLGNYTILNIKNVSTTDAYSGMTDKAASSLIGNVGSDEGTNIHLTFANMDLSGVKSSSIFSRATFLESFRYRNASTCRGVYNFTSNVSYTVGQELSNSIKNPGQQYWFYQAEQISDNYVCGAGNEPATFFATDTYLRYVYQVENNTYHEIDVNLSSETLQGCGTYSDPYVITDGTQLKNFADILSNTTPGLSPITWTIKMNPDVLSKTFDQETTKVGNNHACVAYTSTATGWQDAGTTGDDATATANNVAAYLRNAYYMIDGEITMPSIGWAGLGTSANPFSGVIVGSNHAKVSIPQTGTETQYGGLIKFSQGSVVKDLEIVYTGTPTVSAYSTNNNIPSSTDSASFFGGVVGWCLGGDTIIDTVEVTYPSAGVSINGTTNLYLTAVGGYVGMVGGAMNDAGDSSREKYGGGVVFRNMADGSGMTDGNAAADKNYFYVNPFVGRVLDGYAMLENPSEGSNYATSLNNTDKNYTIPTISPGTHLTRTEDTVTVNDAQGLWLLSAIANSGAGAMTYTNCLAYYVGKPRTGTYDNVGKALTENSEEWTDETCLGGVGGTGNGRTTCYLSKYLSGAFDNLCSSNGVSIVLNSNCDMSVDENGIGFGNGFRGIGISYGTNADTNSNYRLLQVAELDGNGSTVTLAQNRKEYTEEKDSWTSIGSGLFVLLRVPNNGSFSASNLTLEGSTGITYYTGLQLSEDGNIKDGTTIIGSLETGKRLSLVGAGMLAGNLAKNGTVSSFSLDGISLTGTSNKMVTVNENGVGSTNAGGLVGALWNNGTISSVTLTDCTMDNVAVSGRMNVGGFLGYVSAGAVSINYSQDETLKNIQTTSTQISPRSDNNVGACGVGGLIGYNKSALTINASNATGKTEPPRLTMENMNVTNSVNNTDTADKSHAGGLVGLWVEAQNGAAKIINVTMSGQIVIVGGGDTKPNTSVGGLAGAIQWALGTWNDDSGNCSLQLKGLQIASGKDSDGKNSSMKIKSGRQVGGLFGMAIIQKSFTIDDVIIGGDGCPVTISNTYGMTNQSIAALIGIALDAQNLSITNTQIINTNVLVKDDGDRGAGLVVGFVQNGPAKIDLRNLTLRDSAVVTQNENLRTGLLYGRINSSHAHTITGANILVKNCVSGLMLQPNNNSYDLYDGTMDIFTPSKDNVGLNIGGRKPYSVLAGTPNEVAGYTSDRKGIWGGDSGGKTVKLVGVSIQQKENTLPMKDFGTAPSADSCVIRADYNGAANGFAAQVTKKPDGALTIGATTFTGDGAAFMTDGTTSIASQIWNESNGTANLNWKHYSQIKDGSLAYLKGKSSIITFSDYETAGENTYPENASRPQNFPVICLQTSSSTEINNSLFSCISLLTNWEEYSNWSEKTYYKLSLTSYKWTENGFVENNDPSLWLGEDGKFYLYPGKYDNQKNQFNLIDVAYYDPSYDPSVTKPTENDVVYHLYIPMVVKKMFGFKFWAAAKLGTDYTDSGYPLTGEDALSKAVIGSHGQKVTALLTYEYQWTKAEWETAINSGQNLLWNFQHQVKLANGSGLPSGTKLTLVDLGQEDKAFFWETTETTSIRFGNFEDGSGQAWSPVYLCDLLNLKATEDTNGIYVLAGENADGKDSTGATIRAGGLYYRPAEETDAEKQHYTINVGLGETEKVTEQFYLTIQTPENAAGMVNADIESPNPLVNPTTNGGLPTKAEKANDDRTGSYMFAWNASENKLILGSFFAQNLTATTTRGNDRELITANDSAIDITLETDISIKEAAQTLYKIYASGQTLHHCFELKAYAYDKNKDETSAVIAAGTEIAVQFYKGENKVGQTVHYYVDSPTPSYRLYFPVVIPATEVDNGLNLRAEVSLNYSAAAIVEQFPSRESETDQAGITIAATSNLAYTSDSLRSSPLRSDEKKVKKGDDVPHYYRNQEGAATLYYCTYEDQDGSWAEGVSELGINGRDGNSFAIHTAAAYNVSALPEAASATKLRCTVELQWQTEGSSYDSPSYESVSNLSSYLTELTVSAGTTGTVLYSKKDALSGTVEFTRDEIDGFAPDIPIEIPIDLVVRTGEAFEGDNLTYANYRVRLKVELLDGNGDLISGSDATDYIVYTNAKIYRGLIGSSTG